MHAELVSQDRFCDRADVYALASELTTAWASTQILRLTGKRASA